MLTPTYQAIKQQVQSAPHIHADETRHQRGNELRWMWLALSKVAVCFMTAYGRGQDATKRLGATAIADLGIDGLNNRQHPGPREQLFHP